MNMERAILLTFFLILGSNFCSSRQASQEELEKILEELLLSTPLAFRRTVPMTIEAPVGLSNNRENAPQLKAELWVGACRIVPIILFIFIMRLFDFATKEA